MSTLIMNTQQKRLSATPNAFNRKASGNNDALGPLETLVKGESWVGDTGFNLMVVPSPLGEKGFIVMISQLFETDVFTAVPAPVPNRSRDHGTEQLGAVKYSQKVAEKKSKNILHEETGMWLYQTLGVNEPTTPPNGLQAVDDVLNSDVTTYPVIRSGVIPHGNTFQSAGTLTSFSGTTNPPLSASGDVSKYLKLENFPTVGGQLNFLPVFEDGSDPTELQKDYKAEISAAISRLNLPAGSLTVDQFINPIGFLNKYAVNIVQVDSLAVSTADNLGMVLNIPFIKAVAGPQDFICTFVVETIQNATPMAPETDENPTYFQIQYLQSIPLLFPKGYNGKDVIFPHWNVNTLIAI